MKISKSNNKLNCIVCLTSQLKSNPQVIRPGTLGIDKDDVYR